MERRSWVFYSRIERSKFRLSSRFFGFYRTFDFGFSIYRSFGFRFGFLFF